MSSTDTNQASELYELCKKVYELTGWDEVDKFWHRLISLDAKGWSEYKLQDYKPDNLFGMQIVPLYTSDYLLEKLPKSYKSSLLSLYRSQQNSWWSGYSPILECKADTPLKALLKLTIALSEAGALK